MNNKTTKKLQELQAEYPKRLSANLETIIKQWRSLNLHFDKLGFKELHRNVHSLCGSSGTYGYSSFSQAARDLEIYLKQLLHYQTLDAIQQSEVSRLIQRLKDILKENKNATLPSVELANKILNRSLIVYLYEKKG